MGKGPGQVQLYILTLLLETGGALSLSGLMANLINKGFWNKPESEKEYHRTHNLLSRSLRGLRSRRLVQTYKGVHIAGRPTVIAALTRDGTEMAKTIEWAEAS